MTTCISTKQLCLVVTVTVLFVDVCYDSTDGAAVLLKILSENVKHAIIVVN